MINCVKLAGMHASSFGEIDKDVCTPTGMRLSFFSRLKKWVDPPLSVNHQMTFNRMMKIKIDVANSRFELYVGGRK